MNKHLSAFAEKYVHRDFDPLANVVWPDNASEEEKFWTPIAAQIAAGPKSATEIDIVKTSLLSEARTADQEVHFNQFVELESALFSTAELLADALRNSDDISGQLKLQAYDALLQANLVVFQVGTVFADELARQRFFQWGGLLFIDFDKAPKSALADSPEAMFRVVTALGRSIAFQAAEEVGAHKLAAVFRAWDKGSKKEGFVRFINFCCILTAKGVRWEDNLSEIIERMDKNSFYLSAMLIYMIRTLKYEVIQAKERERLKRLVAMIQAKRAFKKSNPSAKLVNKMLNALEQSRQFDPAKSQ